MVTVTVACAALTPSGVTDPGATEQEACSGAPLQLKDTLWLNPPMGATFKVYVAEDPAETVAELGEAATEKSEPVPVRVTVCGLPAASCVTVYVPLRAPPAVGAKVMLMVQLAPASRLLPQLCVWAKSPETVKLLIVMGAPPLLESVSVWGALVEPTIWGAKPRLVVERLSEGLSGTRTTNGESELTTPVTRLFATSTETVRSTQAPASKWNSRTAATLLKLVPVKSMVTRIMPEKTAVVLTS